MRKLLLIIVSLFSYFIQAQEFEWVNFYDGNNQQRPVSMSVDEEGNQYATFNFVGIFNFDTFAINISGNNYNGIVLKQKHDGSVIWFKHISPLISGHAIYNINSRFNSKGNLIVLTASTSPLLIENDTINRYGSTSNYALYLLEFDTSGKLIHSAHIIEGSLISLNYTQNYATTDSDDNLYIGLNYSGGQVKIYDSNGVDTLDFSINRIVVSKFSNSGKNYEWSKQYSTTPLYLNSLKVDKSGNVYLAFLRTGIVSLTFNGQTVPQPQTSSGLVFILDANGNDKNYFYLESSGSTFGLRSTFLDLAVHDTNSIFVTGSYQGDSAKFGSKWLTNKKGGVYFFYAKYDNKGNNIWVKQEDTSRSNSFLGQNYYGSMSNFEDKYVYSSMYMPSYYYPIRIDGQDYGANTSGYGFNAKVDERGNILWGFKTYFPFVAQGTDKYGNFYFQGTWLFDTIRFGNFWSVASSSDAFIGKTFDYAIIRGDVRSGPYCAGDTLLIPYTKLGTYNDSNYFIAELSDEYGNFTGTERELGRIQSTDSGTIIGILPLFEVASSDLYRIRIRSTNPQVQSFYKEDTLKLLIYSRDKADPGPPELVCYGDSFQLRTFGGTAWEWSPAYNMDDSTSRTPFIIPDKDTVYRIVISDSSGCGEADTAFKQIFVREHPKVSTEDSLATCHNADAELIAHFESGDTAGYHWNWYVVDSLNQWQLLKTDSFKLTDTLYYRLPSEITTYQTLVVVLDDECSVVKDTAYINLHLTQERMLSEISNSDSIACYNSNQTLTAHFRQGDPETYTWEWFEVESDTQFNLLKTGGLAAADTLVVQPGVDVFEFQRYVLISKDDCTPFIDTNFYTVYIDQSRPEAELFPQDSFICPGTGIEFSAQFDSGSIMGYNWIWLNQNGMILNNDTGFVSVNFETIPQFTNHAKQTFYLVLSDNCSPYKDTAQIDIYPREPISVSATPVDTLLCAGQEVTYTASGTGGVFENYQYRWEDAETGELLGEEETLNVTASTTIPIPFGIRVILTDGCMPQGDSTIVSLRVNPPLKAVLLSRVEGGVDGDNPATDTTVCYGSQLSFFAQGFGGDSSGYSFNWYLDDSLIGTETTVTFNPVLLSGVEGGVEGLTFTLVLTDNCTSLSDTQSISINILPPLEINDVTLSGVEGDIKGDTICRGEAITLTAFPTGGIPENYQYQWFVDGTLIGTDSTMTHDFTFTLSPISLIQLVLSDNCSNPNDTFTKHIIFRPELDISLTVDNPCANPSALITATLQGGQPQGYHIEWFDQAGNLLGEDLTLTVTPQGVQTYTVILNDGCTEIADTATISIGSVPDIVVTATPDEGCEPLPVTFEIETNYPDGYTWNLNPGDGNNQNGLTQSQITLIFPTGTYFPMASITTDFGCSNNFDNLTFEVFPKPQAYFSFHPETPSLDSPFVSFTNLSTGALFYYWNIKPVGNFEDFEPNVTYPDTGLYHITLIAETDKGCLDTFTSSLRVLPQYHVYLPSAFSPNGDGLNDTFRPVVAGVAEMTFQVYNRWGETVFSGKNIETWDGTFKGKPVPEGIYVYSVQVLNMLGERQSFSGSLTVLR